VPSYDVNVYIVLDDFGKIGRAYRETDEAEADLENVIENMMEGNTIIPCELSDSTPPRDGHATSQKMPHGRWSSA
jgi:hypothetical protein